jgi:hypothetical protein
MSEKEKEIQEDAVNENINGTVEENTEEKARQVL